MNNRNALRFASLAIVVANLSGCKLFDSGCREYPTELPNFVLPKMVVGSMYSYDIIGFVENTGFLTADEVEIIDSDSARKFEIHIGSDWFGIRPELDVWPRTVGNNYSFGVIATSYGEGYCEDQRATFKVIIPEVAAKPASDSDSLDATGSE